MSMPNDQVPILQFRKISKLYRSGSSTIQAVNNIDLDIMKGEYVDIMGASGSGKSTFMNIIGCLDRCSTGDYVFDGINISSLTIRHLARLRNERIGFVFQNFNLLGRATAIENVELPLLYCFPFLSKRQRRDRALFALSRVGLCDRLNHTPNQLSGGQQQRVAIARALVNEPDILLADEPTGNLDSNTSLEILKLFHDLNDARITIIMVTHDKDIALFGKRLIYLRDGSIVRDDVNSERRFFRGSTGSSTILVDNSDYII